MLFIPESTGLPIVDRIFDRIQQAFTKPTVEYIEFKVWNAAPAKPFSGMVVHADGVNWNPGAGAGIYVYRGGAWNLLG